MSEDLKNAGVAESSAAQVVEKLAEVVGGVVDLVTRISKTRMGTPWDLPVDSKSIKKIKWEIGVEDEMPKVR